MRDHVALVELSEGADGTRIDYSVRSTPAIPLPGAGLLLGALLKQGIGGLLDGIVRAAEEATADTDRTD